MGFIRVPWCHRVAVRQTYSGVGIVNTFYVKDDDHSGADAFERAAGLAEDVWNNWRDQIMPHLANAVHLVGVDAVNTNEEDGVQASFAAAEVIGGIAQQSLPAMVTIVVTKRTARPGRNFTGRMLLAGVTEADWQGGGQTALPGAFITALNADLSDFLDGIVDGSRGPGDPNREMVVASLFNGKDPVTGKPLPRAEGIVEEVTSLTASPLVGTLRTRIKR